MKVLIVEDEEKLAKLIKQGLKKEGFSADYITDGEVAERRIEMSYDDYDLIILDLMLPSKTGLEICRDVRKLNISTPILILTAKDAENDKVELLNSGADDYLVKPFKFGELLARIRAITRRPQKTVLVELKVSDLVLNPNTGKVSRSNKDISLTLKEFRILEYLMRHPNEIINREDMMSNVWDFDFDSFSNVLDVFINKLRKKIDKDFSPKLIETVRGMGYKLNGD